MTCKGIMQVTSSLKRLLGIIELIIRQLEKAGIMAIEDTRELISTIEHIATSLDDLSKQYRKQKTIIDKLKEEVHKHYQKFITTHDVQHLYIAMGLEKAIEIIKKEMSS